ncbi:lectin-like [Centropristis striata]|uniref:lectin-like n=1 Tax=Centropristis striata TaxID=184440 RepID=UPI0027DED43F|nr:lectin-like [Centropristis striata]
MHTERNSNIKYASVLCVIFPLHSSSLDLFSGLDVTFVLINNNMSWSEAQSYCREHHTDLASVRNMAENQKVQELIPEGVKYVWIGLFRDSWKWSDGSRSSFKNWMTEEPTGFSQACAAADFSSSGGWGDENCDLKLPFVCYSPPKCIFELSDEL